MDQRHLCLQSRRPRTRPRLGLVHSNLWQVSNRNPISPNGRSLEYGDPFDIMGTAFEPSGDFNLPEKHPPALAAGHRDSQRFHERDVPRVSLRSPGRACARPAARPAGGAGRATLLWIGLRQMAPATVAGVDGAYIVWAYDAGPTELLDLVTPGRDAREAPRCCRWEACSMTPRSESGSSRSLGALGSSMP